MLSHTVFLSICPAFISCGNAPRNDVPNFGRGMHVLGFLHRVPIEVTLL